MESQESALSTLQYKNKVQHCTIIHWSTEHYSTAQYSVVQAHLREEVGVRREISQGDCRVQSLPVCVDESLGMLTNKGSVFESIEQ